MATRQIRNHVAVATAGLAVTALLAGPTIATGLDVAGTTGSVTNQVASTTQGAVTTVQQTTQQVASTVQTTVQPVVEAAPAPQQVVTQAQQTVQTVTAAAPRPSAPARTQPTRAAAPKRIAQPQRAVTRGAAKTRLAPRVAAVAPSAAGTIRAATQKVGTTARQRQTRGVTLPRRSASTEAVPTAPTCSLTLVSQLLPALNLGALLSPLCSITELLNLNPSSGYVAQAQPPATGIGKVLAVASAAGGALHARPLAGAGAPRVTTGSRTAVTGSASRSANNVLGAAGRGTSGRGAHTPFAPYSAYAGPAVATANHAASHAGSGQSHHGVFSGPVDGTQTLALILIADLALLAGVLMWRVAQRWVVPRFA